MSTIKSKPGTKEFRQRFDRAMQHTSAPVERVEQPHECEHCGRVMRYADQSCACLARRPLA